MANNIMNCRKLSNYISDETNIYYKTIEGNGAFGSVALQYIKLRFDA